MWEISGDGVFIFSVNALLSIVEVTLYVVALEKGGSITGPESSRG